MGIKGFSKGGDDFVSKFLRATVHDSTGLDAVTPFVAPLTGLEASGGVINDYTDPTGNVYRAHIFTSSGTFTVTHSGIFPIMLNIL